jgi:FBD
MFFFLSMLIVDYPRLQCIRSIGQGPDTGFWEQQIPFGFFERHLKSVILVNFFGLRTEVEFVKFLVRHGQVLERITIVCEHKLTAAWEKTKRRELRLRNRASMDLKVVFLRNADFDSDSCEWAPLFYRPLPTY